MTRKEINRIDYRNKKKNMDFEIIPASLFFATRSHRALVNDYRVNFWSIIYILEGSGSHFIDFKEFRYKKGDILFIRKNQVHHYVINEKLKGYIMHINEPFFYSVPAFDGDIFLEFLDRSSGSPLVSLDTSESSSNHILMDLIYKEYCKNDENINTPLIASLFQAFVLSISHELPQLEEGVKSRDYAYFKNFRDVLETNYRKTRTVEDYAQMIHVSKKTLNKATRSIVGLSAKAFITERVVLEIKRLLSQGELMNYEIAELLGFKEIANMTKFFKHNVGVSPKVFKEVHKK